MEGREGPGAARVLLGERVEREAGKGVWEEREGWREGKEGRWGVRVRPGEVEGSRDRRAQQGESGAGEERGGWVVWG